MALTWSIAGLQSALDAYEAAYRAGNLPQALIELTTAETIRLLTPDSVADPASGAVTMPNLQWFSEKKKSLQTEIGTVGSRKRIIQARTGYHG